MPWSEPSIRSSTTCSNGATAWGSRTSGCRRARWTSSAPSSRRCRGREPERTGTESAHPAVAGDPAGVADSGPPDDVPGGGGVNDRTTADVHRDVGDRAAVEDEVARLELAGRDALGGAHLAA